MDNSWLVRLYEDVGMEADQALRAAEETRVRLLRRERPRGIEPRHRRSLTEFLVRDPLVSLNRIVGRGDAGLPFFDDETKQLSLIAFGNVLSDVGVDPVVAMAYAKVVIEAFEPKDFYEPVWIALGREAPVDLEELRRMDWTPLRAGLPPIAAPDTVVTRAETKDATLITPSTPTTTPPRASTATATAPASQTQSSTQATNAQAAAIRRAPPQRPMKGRPSPPMQKPKK